MNTGVFDMVWTVEGGMMTMQTPLNMNGKLLWQPTLGIDLNLNGRYVIYENEALFGGTDGRMTMMNDLNMNSYLFLQPKFGGNLNLNDHCVYNNDRPLFSTSAHGLAMQKV